MSFLRISGMVVALAAGLGLFVLPQYLVAQPASQPKTELGNPTDRAAIERIVRDYLLANPELLREMAENLKTKDDAKANAERDSAFKSAGSDIYDSEHQVVLGNPQGDVTLVEFFDYNCGYCKQALADTEALIANDPKLKLVLKEFPVLGQDSVDAARVAIVVNRIAPDKYLEFHRKLLGAEGASAEAALKIATDMGLDAQRLSAGLTDPKVESGLVEVQKLARKLGINGTPTYVIADRVLPGAAGAENLALVIANVRKCGKAECS